MQMRTVISQKTALIMQYLFFVLGLVIGVIEQGSLLLWVCIVGATLALIVTYYRAGRLKRIVQRERKRAQAVSAIVAPLHTLESIGIQDEYCWKSGHKGGWDCADCKSEGKV